MSYQCCCITLQASEFGPFNGALTEPLNIFFVGKIYNIFKNRRNIQGARFKSRIAGLFLKTVPRTDILANVTTVKPAFEITGGRGC